jgi:hypothetical protein
MMNISLSGPKGNLYKWGLTRKPILRRRYGITKGKTMTGIHFGNYTLYFSRLKPLKRLGSYWAIEN